MTEITSEVANAITEYKRRERLTRQKFANGLNVLLEAVTDQEQLDVQTQEGGDIELARDFYEAQLAGKPEFPQLIAALTGSIAKTHGIMLQAQTVDPSIFFGQVPPVE